MVETEVADAAPAEEEVAQPADSSSQEGTDKNYDRRKSKPLKEKDVWEILDKAKSLTKDLTARNAQNGKDLIDVQDEFKALKQQMGVVVRGQQHTTSQLENKLPNN